MMSQQRSKKAVGATVEAARGRQSVKASGDGVSSKVQPRQPTTRSTSKSKIPKNLRYDLENALVGLCDVWFEEIKPHMVRNNIKVHVHGGGAGPASGDHQRLPPGAAGCSHLAPGAASDLYQRAFASSADCCSTPPTASRARCRRPPASCRPACPPPVLSPSKLQASLLNPCRPCEAKITRNSRPRRIRTPRSRPQPQASSNWRTPRLCRTYSVLSPRTGPPERRAHTADPRMRRRKQYKNRPKMIDKSTQTPSLRKPEVLPIWQEELQQDNLQQKLYNQNLIREERSPHEPTRRTRATSPSCPRCPATTNMRRSLKQPPPPNLPLFKDDLIDIIAEKSDKQLRVLFRSPTRTPASSLTLFQPHQPHVVRRLAPSKRTPWR